MTCKNYPTFSFILITNQDFFFPHYGNQFCWNYLRFFKRNLKEMVICYQNCSVLLSMRKTWSSDREKMFEIRGWRLRICKIFEINKTIYLNSEWSVQFLKQNAFLTCSWRFFRSSKLSRTIRIQIGKKNWNLETYRKN